MEAGNQDALNTETTPSENTGTPAPGPVSPVRQSLRFTLHLATIYLIVQFGTPTFAGWTRTVIVRLLNQNTTSSFEFFSSHLLAFSFIPAFIAGFANARLRHRIAQFVWTVPLVVLAYKVSTFPHTHSALYQTPWLASAIDHYFNWNFSIPEYYSYDQLFRSASGPDILRGVDQWRFTAPLYAGIGYSLATFICVRRNKALPEVLEVIERWHSGTRLSHPELQTDPAATVEQPEGSSPESSSHAAQS